MHGPIFGTGSNYVNIDQEEDVFRGGWKEPKWVTMKVARLVKEMPGWGVVQF